MEVNCNGLTSSPESKTNPEVQGTKQLTEKQEDQQNATPSENTETQDTLCKQEEHQTCNAPLGEHDLTLQQLPAPLNSDITREQKDGERGENEVENLNSQEETKRENEEVSQNGKFQ